MTLRLPTLFAALLFLAACTDAPEPDTPDVAPEIDTTETPMAMEEDFTIGEAAAVLNPTAGNEVRGQVVFTSLARGVRVLAQVNGLPPGEHGFHIHEVGDCSAPDASSAGGHFNPADAAHGAPDDAQRHAGDLGNLVANADSTAGYDRVDTVIALNGPNTIVGKAVIVHAGQDDFTSQPTGDAGSRLACGIIEAAGDPDGDA